ncbi:MULTISPECIES: DUF7010 family protein [Pseudoalteromonas]|uniref:DUF7010 family protein n=1 Tax=Pseudoalteromonas TaxID=53246 RepID=UPI00083CC67F|nr:MULTISPECIES: hypothetical protein [Pseudoalteromonas]ODB35336.1 hypothetical protein BB427_17620 [Pseudoalteromonas sp. BMB]QUI61411.1 hypothetical protein GSF04_02435 [Pseudoalteromonas sp. A22]QZO14918.1 hypothetical protein K5642_21820 [Pseudoalteromonas piscicida]USE71112.1 hypothetical protein CTT31_18595 [Pseudoalteromonas flavipulchra]
MARESKRLTQGDIMDNRDELINLTKKGIGFPFAGLMVICFCTLAIHFMPQRQALVMVIFATGSTFPIAFLISKMFKVNPFAKHPPLSNLGTVLACAQFLYWPVLILVFQLVPNWFPFAFAILFGSHFIPFGWLYKSRAYYFLGIAMPLVGCVMTAFGSEFSYSYTFWALIPLYFFTCILLLKENSSFRYAEL